VQGHHHLKFENNWARLTPIGDKALVAAMFEPNAQSEECFSLRPISWSCSFGSQNYKVVATLSGVHAKAEKFYVSVVMNVSPGCAPHLFFRNKGHDEGLRLTFIFSLLKQNM